MNTMLSKNELVGRVEPSTLDWVREDVLSSEVPPQDLVHGQRFDVFFKTFYLKTRVKNFGLARRVYLEHLKAFGAGAFSEGENPTKNSEEAFLKAFDEIYTSINIDGFDRNKSFVPVASDGVIINGSHRLASALVCGKNVSVVHCPRSGPRYDFLFFYNRGVTGYFLDIAAKEFVEICRNAFVALVWPSAVGQDEVIDSILGNVVYKKNVYLGPNGAKNLMIQVYSMMKWIGTPESNFVGAHEYVGQCFKFAGPLRVVAFIGKDLESVVSAKAEIRDIFAIGNSSIHISDTHEEAINLARLLFNDNGIHFLNHANPSKYGSFRRNYVEFGKFLQANHFCEDDFVLDSGMVLASYGLRQANDVDYLTSVVTELNDHGLVNNHAEKVGHHQTPIGDLIYDPKYYFHLGSIKLLSFRQVYTMKGHRGGHKDRIDREMMDAFLGGMNAREKWARIRQRIYSFKFRLRRQIVEVIRMLGFYEQAKQLYRKIFY